MSSGNAHGTNESRDGFGDVLFQKRLGVFAGGGGLAAKHASQLGHTLLAFEQTDVRDRAEKFRFFGDDVVRRGAGGDRREMRDTNDLSVLPEPAHLIPFPELFTTE